MKLFTGLALILSFALAGATPASAAAGAQRVVLAGGCFWGMQLVFGSIIGVDSAPNTRP
jgi:hypothetical protein